MRTGCPWSPTQKSSTNSYKKWGWRPNSFPSQRCFPLRNGHLRWFLNPCSAFSSSMKSLQSNNSTSRLFLLAYSLKMRQTMSSSWSSTQEMHAEPSRSSTSPSTHSNNTQKSSLPTHTSRTLNSTAPISTPTQGENSSRTARISWMSIRVQYQKVNQVSKTIQILTSLPLLSRTMSFTSWMEWLPHLSLTEIARKKTCWPAEQVWLSSTWQETQTILDFRW